MATLSSQVRQAVFERAEHRCEYCQTARRLIGMPLVVDHIIPRSRGGTDEVENLCAACYRCNEYKGARVHALDPQSKTLVPIYNPRTQNWSEHFQWGDGGIHIIAIHPLDVLPSRPCDSIMNMLSSRGYCG